MKRGLKYLLVFVLWNLAASGVVLWVGGRWGALWALAVVLALYALVLRGYLLRAEGGSAERRRDALRLRPLEGESRRWVMIAVPVLLALSWSFSNLYVSLVPVPAVELSPFEQLTARPEQRLLLAVLAVGIAPVVEEFFFRGLIQHAMEEAWGARAGIAGAAALFALVHFLPWIFPLHALLGLAFGYAVYATRSIWAGVVLHASNNALAMLGLGVGDAPQSVQTLWQSGLSLGWWVNLAVFAASVAVAAWAVRGLWRSGHAVRLRHA